VIELKEDFSMICERLTKMEDFRNEEGFILVDKQEGEILYGLFCEWEDVEGKNALELLDEYKKEPERYIKIPYSELIEADLWEREKVEECLRLMKKYEFWPKGGLENADHPHTLPPRCPKCGYSKHFADIYCARC